MRELAPDSRADLCHFLGGAEAVEPRHQRGLQACGDGQGRRWHSRGSPLRFFLAPRFHHCLGHFLHEQRDAVRALNYVVPYVRRDELVADNAVDHGLNVALREPIDGESRHVRPSDPGRLELWTERHNQQHRKGANPVDDPTEHFQARWIGPVRILEDHQQGVLPRQCIHLRGERFQRFLPALLWFQVERRITSVVRERQHLGEQCCILLRGRGLR